jgi:hypothetical protein
MSIPIYFGQSTYGYIYNADGSVDATQFFHIYYLPLFPLRPVRVGDGEARWRVASILYTFLKVSGFVLAIGVGIWGMDRAFSLRRSPLDATLGIAIPALIGVGVVTSWFTLGQQRGTRPSLFAMLIGYGIVAAVFGIGSSWAYKERVRRAAWEERDRPAGDPLKDADKMAAWLGNMARNESIGNYGPGCEKGVALDCYRLGHAYLNAPKDPDIAAKWIGRACELGELRGCDEAAQMVQNVDGARALALYGKACEAGQQPSCNGVAIVYFNGLGGVRADEARGATLFAAACDKGEAYACSNYATAATQGRGVKKNAATAAAYRKKACSLGHKPSCKR